MNDSSEVLIVCGLDDQDIELMLHALYKEIERLLPGRHAHSPAKKEQLRRMVKATQAMRRSAWYEAFSVKYAVNSTLLNCFPLFDE